MKKIALYVCLAHFFVLMCMSIHHFSTKKFRSDKPICVRTFVQQQPTAHRPVPQVKQVKEKLSQVVAMPKVAKVVKKENVKPEKKEPKSSEQNVVVTKSTPKPQKTALSIPLPVSAVVSVGVESETALAEPNDCELVIAF